MGNYLFRELDGCGTGIGHKLFNYLSSIYYARYFGLKHAYSPFNMCKCEIDNGLHNIDWEDFFSLGNGEIWVDDLIKQGYVIRDLYLNENLPIDKSIVNTTYTNIGFCIIETWTHDIECVNKLRYKYLNSPYRNIMKTTYSSDFINITIHIRRGDYLEHADGDTVYHEIFKNRLRPLHYYTNIMDKIIELNCFTKPILFHLHTEQNIEDLNIFRKYNNINVYINNHLRIKQVFPDFVNSDIIIGSESTLTLTTYMINDKILFYKNNYKMPPHKLDNVVICSDSGTFDDNLFRRILKKFNLNS